MAGTQDDSSNGVWHRITCSLGWVQHRLRLTGRFSGFPIAEMAEPDQRIPAVHANWTTPRRSGEVLLPEEVITMMLSALAWRRFHGTIALYADTPTVTFLQKRGILDMYDDVRSAEIDSIDRSRFSPDLYFNLSKLVALRACAAPVAVVDLDLFLRRPLPAFGPNSFVFAHYELPNSAVYPPLAQLPNPNHIAFPDWDDDLLVCNTAIAAFGSQRHLDDFLDLAFSYMDGNNEPAPVDPDARLLFAEQRLAPYTAQRNGIDMAPLSDSAWDNRQFRWRRGEPTQAFHHTWHRKRLFPNPRTRDRYCLRLIRELLSTFPEARDLLGRDPVLNEYALQVRS